MTAARPGPDQAHPLPAFLDDRSMAIPVPAHGAAKITAETSTTGRHGVALAEIGFAAETSLSGTPSDHLIGVFVCPPAPTRHTMAGKRSHHMSETGLLCICPANADYTTEYQGPVEGILLQVSTECLAIAGAQLARHSARLVEDMNGRDDRLFAMTQAMAAEVRRGHPNGALLWSSMTDALLRHLAGHHLSEPTSPLRGAIGPIALGRLDRFIQDRLHTSIDLVQLAEVVGCDQYHFAHRFSATVGVSPYRYVLRRRLERAYGLLRAGRQSIADVAAATGFSDQSHLTNWTRRVYGTSPARLLARSDAAPTADAVRRTTRGRSRR